MAATKNHHQCLEIPNPCRTSSTKNRNPSRTVCSKNRPIDRIGHLLRQRYEDRPDVFISGGVFVAYDATDGNRRVKPDLFIAFDVDNAGIRENLPNFWIWEIGKAPDFVMEVASAEHGGQRFGLEAGVVPAAGDTGVLAV